MKKFFKNLLALILIVTVVLLLIPCKLMELSASILDRYLKNTFMYKLCVDIVSEMIDFKLRL